MKCLRFLASEEIAFHGNQDSQRSAYLTLQTLKRIRIDVAAKLFNETIVKKVAKHEFIECPILPRKRKTSD